MADQRFDTDPKVKSAVWSRAAGHCELCSKDLTSDLITLTPAKLGEVAHIIPASPSGPRAVLGQHDDAYQRLTNDPENLMLLCASCHYSIDKTPDGYPTEDLSALHKAFTESILFAARHAKYHKAAGVILIGKHFTTPVRIDRCELQMEMWRNELQPVTTPLIIELPEPDQNGRDNRYYQNVRDRIKYKLDRELTEMRGELGDDPIIGIAGIADIPSLIIFGQILGDRRRRKIYSLNRHTRLKWPKVDAVPPDFQFTFSGAKNRINALAISLSAEIADRDVLDALPGCEIAKFTTTKPSYDLVQSPEVITKFAVELQNALSTLEASSPEPIHVFAAIPAALAIEFGSLLSTNHQHKYVIYDRDQPSNTFSRHLNLN